MKSLIIISAVAAALAQSSNVFIPEGISSGCSSFLKGLDSDISLNSCTSSLIDATSQFGPGQSTTPSSASIISTLDSICSTSASTCNQQMIGGKLSSFYAACSAELTSTPNVDVMRTYDVVYALIPFKEAVCCKSDSAKYCVMQESTYASSAASGVSGAKSNFVVSSNPQSSDDSNRRRDSLWTSKSVNKRAAAQTPAIVPNTTTYRDSNLLFLFLTPQTPSAQLCTTCTRNILMSYITFETSVPYAPGLGKSPLMGGQPDLYNAVQSTCGKNFFSGAAQAAGGLSSGVLGNSNAAPRSVSQGFTGIITGALMGVVALMVAAVL